MAITLLENAATISSTEYSLPNNSTTLTPQTDDCELGGWIDAFAMTASETYEVKMYEKINGGTQRLLDVWTLTGAQSRLFLLPRVVVVDGWDVTCKKTAGTDRSIRWSLRKIWVDGFVSPPDGGLTSAKFADGFLTNAKLANDFGAKPLNAGTASAGAAQTITLAASASTTANLYRGALVAILAGTGTGQARRIAAYSTGRVATVDEPWITNPDGTSVYVVLGGAGHLDQFAAVVSDAGNTAATFKVDLTEATNDYWKDAFAVFRTGALRGQVKKVTAYTGATKFLTFSAPGFTGAPAASDVLQLVNR